MSTEDLIISRLLCELKGVERIALGPGLPKRIIPYLDPQQSWVDLGRLNTEVVDVDVAVVEAIEVSANGELTLVVGTNPTSINAGTWIVSGLLRKQEDSLQLVKECTLPAQLEGSVGLVVTELGVIRVTQVGFELVEISPGVSSDDIRMLVRASLHVADDLKRIQLCA